MPTRAARPARAIDIPMVGGAIVDRLQRLRRRQADPDPGRASRGSSTARSPSGTTRRSRRINSGVKLPDATIATFHRSDSSGTTDNFTKFLGKTAAADWTTTNAKDWTATRRPGRQGLRRRHVVGEVHGQLHRLHGAVLRPGRRPRPAWVDNGGGAVEATSENAAKTIAAATVTGSGNDLALTIDYTTKTGLPDRPGDLRDHLREGRRRRPARLTKSFLTYTSGDAGQGKLTELGYVPITGDLLTKVRTAVSSITA